MRYRRRAVHRGEPFDVLGPHIQRCPDTRGRGTRQAHPHRRAWSGHGSPGRRRSGLGHTEAAQLVGSPIGHHEPLQRAQDRGAAESGHAECFGRMGRGQLAAHLPPCGGKARALQRVPGRQEAGLTGRRPGRGPVQHAGGDASPGRCDQEMEEASQRSREALAAAERDMKAAEDLRRS